MYIKSTKLIDLLTNMVSGTCDSWEAALKEHDFTEVEKCRARAKALQEVIDIVLEMDKEEVF